MDIRVDRRIIPGPRLLRQSSRELQTTIVRREGLRAHRHSVGTRTLEQKGARADHFVGKNRRPQDETSKALRGELRTK